MRATQLSLFQEDAAAASLASAMQLVRASMNRVAKSQEGAISREHIADSMTSLADTAGVSLVKGRAKRVSKEMLDKWLTPSDRDHVPSLLAVVAFCQVTNDVTPLKPLLEAVGCEVMTPEDKQLRNYARAILAEKEARKRKKQLEAGL